MKPVRAIGLALALGALVALGALATRVHRTRTAPELFLAAPGSPGWIVGPPAGALEGAAERHIAAAAAELNDTSQPSAERLQGLRRELEHAERLLVGAVRARPTDVRLLVRLAALRSKLDPPADDVAARRHLKLVERVSALAPADPDVQLLLGELLLEIGRPEPAVARFRRAVELDRSRTAAVVERLRAELMPAEAIRSALPRTDETLVALAEAYFEEGAAAEYAAILEESLDGARPAPSPEALSRYGDACLRSDGAERLRARLSALAPLSRPEAEAERLHQRARAHLALERTAEALDDAARARALAPDSAEIAVLAGHALDRAGRLPEALRAYRDALGLVARGDGSALARARIYRRIGEAEERRGDPSAAYDAYRMALRLAPDEPQARRRLAAMRASAGLREPG
jgi:tetratricopeptide (TPR) repeat protein